MRSTSRAEQLPLAVPGNVLKASPSDVRRNNRRLIFGLLFPNRALSRAELGRQSGLSRVAASDVVADMLDTGLIRESGQEVNSRKGKRGTLLAVDTQRLRVISIDLSNEDRIIGALTDLLGTPVHRTEIHLDTINHVTTDDILALIDDLIGRAEHIIGIGIAARWRHRRQRHRARLHHPGLARRQP